MLLLKKNTAGREADKRGLPNTETGILSLWVGRGVEVSREDWRGIGISKRVPSPDGWRSDRL